MKNQVAMIATALLLAGCAGNGADEAAEHRPGEPRYIGVCEIDNPEPGVALSRQAYTAPSEEIAQSNLDGLNCTRSWVEPYSSERLEELGDPSTPPGSYQPS